MKILKKKNILSFLLIGILTVGLITSGDIAAYAKSDEEAEVLENQQDTLNIENVAGDNDEMLEQEDDEEASLENPDGDVEQTSSKPTADGDNGEIQEQENDEEISLENPDGEGEQISPKPAVDEDGIPEAEDEMEIDAVEYEENTEENIEEGIDINPLADEAEYTLVFFKLDGSQETIKIEVGGSIGDMMLEPEKDADGIICDWVLRKSVFGDAAVNGRYTVKRDTVFNQALANMYQENSEDGSVLIFIMPRKHINGDVSYCNEYDTEVIPSVAATCLAAGSTESTKCSFCGTVLEEPQEIPALDHEWEKGWSTDNQNHWHMCTREGCNVTDGPVAHTIIEKEGTDATCTTPGLKEHFECVICHQLLTSVGEDREVLLEQDIIDETKPALGHEWGDWKDIGNGQQERTCAICGETQTRNKPTASGGNTTQNTNSGGNNNAQNAASGSDGSAQNADSSEPAISQLSGATPATGDTSNVMLWAVLMILTGCGLGFCMVKTKKKA